MKKFVARLAYTGKIIVKAMENPSASEGWVEINDIQEHVNAWGREKMLNYPNYAVVFTSTDISYQILRGNFGTDGF